MFIELVDDTLCPAQVQLFALERSVDVSQLDAHLAHQQTVVLIGPVDARHALVADLETGAQSQARYGGKVVNMFAIIKLEGNKLKSVPLIFSSD